jgi:DNA repair protein RadA/Sms
MAPKQKTTFLCVECGDTFARWTGQCVSCKVWNSISEHKESALKSIKTKGRGGYASTEASGSQKLSQISSADVVRLVSGISELDRVFGGGIATSSVALIGGDPGAGKTTLLSALAGIMSLQVSTLYVTAEEGLSAYKTRALDRLKIKYDDDNFRLVSEFSLDAIIDMAIQEKAKFLIVDSIQAIQGGDYTGQAGSVSQVKGCAQELNRFAKTYGCTVILVCHSTKGGELAGPQSLNHIVDSSFHIEVNDSGLRIMRPKKNRFGSVDISGIFQMTETGMISVDNPSKIFLSGADEYSSGSAIACIRDGNRNLLLEVQALVTECDGEHPQKVSIGLNHNRLKMLSAVLKKHGRMSFHHDTYVSLIGGLKLPETDTSADLALAAALVSSLKDKPLPTDSCYLGEVSLSGYIRPIEGGVPRVHEAIKHGFKVIYIPQANYHKSMESPGVSIKPIKHIGDMLKDIV